MNAILMNPPKSFAVFSNRENIRRDSFRQPIRRSTMFPLSPPNAASQAIGCPSPSHKIESFTVNNKQTITSPSVALRDFANSRTIPKTMEDQS